MSSYPLNLTVLVVSVCLSARAQTARATIFGAGFLFLVLNRIRTSTWTTPRPRRCRLAWRQPRQRFCAGAR